MLSYFVSFCSRRYRKHAHVHFGDLVMNNAEESLQDGSHLFSTQHPVAPTSVFFASPSVFS